MNKLSFGPRRRRTASAVCLAGLLIVTAACGSDDDGASSETPAPPAQTDAPAQTDPPTETDAPAETDPPTQTDAPVETTEPAAPAEPGGLAEPGTLSGRISGAGATFPTPWYQDLIFDYSGDVQPDVSIDYQSIGSGGGIEQFLQDTVDWGTSERYLREDDLQAAVDNRGCEAIQVPMVYGSVVIAFSDDQFDELVLDAETISAIFRREIINFNDDRLAALNPGFDLPNLDIIPVHRSDGSGTTSVFTTWLEDEDATWADELGSGTEVDWPAGTVGGQGNEGVTAGINQNPGGLGYVNQAYAIENQMPQARVINADGNEIYPTLEATTAAIEALEIPDSFQFDILGVGGDGYPITGTVWNFFYTCGYSGNTAELLIDFWTWATQTPEGDELALTLGYAPLGASLKERVATALQRIGEQDR